MPRAIWFKPKCSFCDEDIESIEDRIIVTKLSKGLTRYYKNSKVIDHYHEECWNELKTTRKD